MSNFLKLYLEINNSNYVFFVVKYHDHDDCELIYKSEVPLKGIENSRITNLEETYNTIKENLYLTEEKFNFSFKEIILIIDNFNPSFVNLSGYKKLNGSQILRENITYILNNLKSFVDETESKKNVLHIFNSKFNLDNKELDNLPIGLFGDFYFHELSFVLIDKNIHKNLKNIFDKCNLKIKKVLIKCFVKGAYISNNNNNIETFFYIKVGKNTSNIFFFENNSLKSQEEFQFGADIIIKDITKITSLKLETVKSILSKMISIEELKANDLVEEIYFRNDPYRKIKKKLIYEIAQARIEEILNIIIFKNINFKKHKLSMRNIFLEIDKKSQIQSFNEIYENIFLKNDMINFNLIDSMTDENILHSASKIVHFGWKKEAIPISTSRKSLIARFFSKIFR